MLRRSERLGLGRGCQVTLTAVLVVALLGLSAGGCREAASDGPEAAVEEGWRWFRGGEFSLAAKAFEAARAAAGTNGVLRQAALYGLANTWSLRRPGENPLKATGYYQEVIAADPASDLAAWSALALARMRTAPVGGELTGLDVQVRAYQEVADAYGSHAAGEEAFLFQQAARLNDPLAGQEPDVLAKLDAYLQANPATPWRLTILRMIAHCCDALGLRERRVAVMLQELEGREAAAAAAGTQADNLIAYWSLATAAHYDLGDFDLARDFYGRLIRDYPTDQRVFPAKQALRRMEATEQTLRVELAAAGEGAE